MIDFAFRGTKNTNGTVVESETGPVLLFNFVDRVDGCAREGELELRELLAVDIELAELNKDNEVIKGIARHIELRLR